MNAWSKCIQDYLDAHRMRPADLARKSGVSPQVISKILNDTREQLEQRPEQRTVELLASAMRVSPDVLLAKVGEAMGLPMIAPVVIYDASMVSNEDLLRALADRLDMKDRERDVQLQRRSPTTQPDRSSRATSLAAADAADLDQYNEETQQEIRDAIADEDRDDPPVKSPRRKRRLG